MVVTGAISDEELAADGAAASEDELEEDEFESGEGAAGAVAPMADEGATVGGGAWPRAKLPRLRPAKTTPKTTVWKRRIVVFTLVPGNTREPKFQPTVGCQCGS
jgi:hypothetical protein